MTLTELFCLKFSSRPIEERQCEVDWLGIWQQAKVNPPLSKPITNNCDLESSEDHKLNLIVTKLIHTTLLFS